MIFRAQIWAMKKIVPATTRHQILLAWRTLTKKSDPTPVAWVSCVDMG